MKILNIAEKSQEEIVKIAESTLRAGGLVIFPTETTYGAGVCATDVAAVEKLLKYKARREGKPMSIAVTGLEMAERFVEVNDAARRIYQRFLPGPVTVVSKSLGVVAPGVASEFGTLGVRIPAYPLVIDIVRQLGLPMTATSANASGEKRPYTIQDIFDGLSEKQKSLIDLVIDAGELPHNPPSTVIDTTLSTPVVFRQGDAQVVASATATELVTRSEQETKDLAKRLVLKNWSAVKETGLVIGLNGSLGMGKTIFVKGLAEFLQISNTITSPTYSYINEYDFVRHGVSGKLFHLDVWKVDGQAALERLELEKLIAPNHVVAVEWISNTGDFFAKMQEQQQFGYFEVNFAEDASDACLRKLLIKE